MTKKDEVVSIRADETPANEGVGENISGRGVFVVETVPIGLSVRTAFLADDGRLLDIPAVFPDVHYAFSQIEELRKIVAQRFAEAAQIGAQVISSQAQMIKTTPESVADTSEMLGSESNSQH